MAWYRYTTYLKQKNFNEFDALHTPGTKAPFSGIYRCEGCGKEVASNVNEPLPTQNHHQHPEHKGQIRWKLIVFADHDPD